VGDVWVSCPQTVDELWTTARRHPWLLSVTPFAGQGDPCPVRSPRRPPPSLAHGYCGGVDEVLGLPAALAAAGRCLVMGVVNVTPDSFSDGGQWFEPGAAIAHGLRLLAEGADLIDVGGESTRPGADRIPVEEELRRVLPVVRELASAGAVISIDTMRARVASAALVAGAQMVNDVSGGQADASMADLIAQARVPFVTMHWRGPSATMEAMAVYDDVVGEVCTELAARLDALVIAGIDPRQVVLDPGLGFAKGAEHNWHILAGLDRLVGLGRPVLIGASRKRFLGTLLAGADGSPAPPIERDAATAATSALAAAAGAWAVRVHKVRQSLDAVRVAAALHRATPDPAVAHPGPAAATEQAADVLARGAHS
jgi:dihydropteroate synthase